MERKSGFTLLGVFALLLLTLSIQVQAVFAASSSPAQAQLPQMRLYLRKTQTGTGPVNLEAQLIIANGTAPITVHLELLVDSGKGAKANPAAIDKSDLKPSDEVWNTWTISDKGEYTAWAHAVGTNAAGKTEVDSERHTFRVGIEESTPIPITSILIPVVVVVVVVVALVVLRRSRRKPEKPTVVVAPPTVEKPSPPPAAHCATTPAGCSSTANAGCARTDSGGTSPGSGEVLPQLRRPSAPWNHVLSELRSEDRRVGARPTPS
jgi:hypothetical protein